MSPDGSSSKLGHTVYRTFSSVALCILSFFMSFFGHILHYLGLMEKKLTSQPITNHVIIGEPRVPLQLDSPCLYENSLSVSDRVAKLEEVVNKIDKPSNVSTSNGEDIDMSPERIKALEAELAETKRVCFHLLSVLHALLEELMS